MKKNQPWILANLERVVLSLPRRNLRKQTARKLRVLESTLQTCATERTRSEKRNLHEVAHLYGASQFCLICEADITVLLCEMMCADEEWARFLFARHLALALVEDAEDVPQVLGRRFRDALSVMVCDQAYLSRLNSIAKGLSESDVDMKKTFARLEMQSQPTEIWRRGIKFRSSRRWISNKSNRLRLSFRTHC
jgi:hypothetical protein